jgi:hypothetical protein
MCEKLWTLPVSLSMTLPRLVRKASAPFAGKKNFTDGAGLQSRFHFWF